MEGTSISTAMGTALSTISTDATSMIATVIPYAAVVLGGLILIGVAIKVFKRFTGR